MTNRVGILGDYTPAKPSLVRTGVSWLDEHTGGGVPARASLLLSGPETTSRMKLAMRIARWSSASRVLWYAIGSTDAAMAAVKAVPSTEASDFCLRSFDGIGELQEQLDRYEPDLVVVGDFRICRPIVGPASADIHREMCLRAITTVAESDRPCVGVFAVDLGKSGMPMALGHRVDISILVSKDGIAKIEKNRFGDLCEGSLVA